MSLKEPKTENTDVHLLEFVDWKALTSAGSLHLQRRINASGITTKCTGGRRFLILYDYDAVASVTQILCWAS